MPNPNATPTNEFRITAPMAQFLDYFGELGPRWGVRTETSKTQALLFLADRPLSRNDIAQALDITKPKATSALKDLDDWEMAHQTDDGRWRTGSEPWDLLFTALETRQQREIAPALDILRQCTAGAKADPTTPASVRRRIGGVLKLVENLAAIDVQSRRLPKSLLPRLVSATGTASRLIDRVFPHQTAAPKENRHEN
ncbi:MAG: hypothetical protein GKS02_09620 [Alphaproteobacteria bacterium]|nr:hypothetical protein [Alphaproteobacteria bacterium]